MCIIRNHNVLLYIEMPIFKTSHPIVDMTFKQQVSLCSSFLSSAHNITINTMQNNLLFQFLRECWSLWVGSIRRQSRSSGCLWRLPPSCLWPSLRCVWSSTSLLWWAKCPESALPAIGPCCVLRPHIGCRCSAVPGKQERLGRSGMGALVPIPLTGYWPKHLQQSRRSPLTTATADSHCL